VLRRHGIPFVAQAHFAAARDTLDAAGMSNCGTVMTEISIVSDRQKTKKKV